MKFKLVESVKQLSENRLKPIYATYSKLDLKNILKNSNDIMRITYCPKEGLWLINKAFDYYHGHAYNAAIENGLANYREDIGRFFYIPYSLNTNNRFKLYDYLTNEFSEIFRIRVYKNFILASGENNNGENYNLSGEDEFFSLFGTDDNYFIEYPNIKYVTDLKEY